MTDTARIRWEPGAEAISTAWFGYAGTIDACLFQILKPVLDDDGFILITHLPGCGGELTRENGNDEALKPEAERWLTEFTASLGAVWPDPLCARCEEPITGTPLTVRDDRQHRTWCSEECRDADAEQSCEQAYRPGVAT